MRRLFFFLLLSLLSIQISNGQDEVNQTNGDGKKDGLWIEREMYGLIECYYKNGVKDGVFKIYHHINGKLGVFGEYKEGKKVGSWYYFDESSLLYLKETRISYNTSQIINFNDGTTVKPQFYSYIYEYYPNGIIKQEGFALYDEIQVDFAEIGTWKYYDEAGSLLETKEFK